MVIKNKLILIFFLLISILFNINTAVSSDKPKVKVTPTPDMWVDKVTFTHGEIEDKSSILGGQYYLLYDNQVNALGTKADYMHFAIKLLNESAVEERSRLTINFAPSFQTLTFHKVVIWRNGIAIEQSIKNKIKLLQREKELENLIYDGRWSATLLLDDVRKGDILEYSYTLIGQNPAYKDYISDTVYLQWADPIQKQIYRLLWPNKTPINVTTSKKIKKELKISIFDNYKEYKIERLLFPTLQIDSE